MLGFVPTLIIEMDNPFVVPMCRSRDLPDLASRASPDKNQREIVRKELPLELELNWRLIRTAA
jgi:hypothetical protein